jgi:hypothetical protein
MGAVDIEKTKQFILECQARTEAVLAASADDHAQRFKEIEASLTKTDALLRRAIKDGIREARAERR